MAQQNGLADMNGYPPGYGGQPGGRPLNVQDALTYLDEVKNRFSNQPDVYNQFLDIMKDFKSQSIDTPGVINRVSTLFKGHRSLIQGFNTFLPPGFKIEVDENGVVHHAQPEPLSYMPPQMMPLQQGPMPTHFQPPPMPPGNYSPHVPTQVPQPQGTPKKTPVEFDHAINYVNKIKTRFQSQPETYKNFLDILHVYQKEQKSIKEVYEQVAVLFQNHPDLLEEFTQFLPEAGVHQQNMMQQQQQQQNLGQVGMGPIPPPSAPASSENFAQSKMKTGSGKSKTSKRGYEESTKPGMPSTLPPQKKLKQQPQQPQALQQQSLRPQGAYTPGMGASIRDVGSELKIKPGNFEEIEYFDKIKKFLNNKHVYAEFLKCLNLFSQEIITRHELVTLIQNFLGGSPDLFEWFKKFIGYKEPPPDRIAPLERLPVVDFSKCRRFGSSYRALPKTYQHPKCSGRTDLCTEVLNDIWVSFPIWSEDAPFLASKKNMFEEILYRAEDERYELDRIIEVNLTTIKVLETAHRKIQGMTPEEAQKFRLPNNFGGSAEAIYHQAIRRIYGDKASEVIEGLKRHPAMAVPVVLVRLHQKDEEWKRAQREWKKLWADTYAKNVHKCLDHQGITFKANDKKNTAQKTLIQEAEMLLQEQKDREGDGVINKLTSHYELYMKDPQIFDDILRILSFFLEKSSGFSGPDKERLFALLEGFVWPFFFLDQWQKPKARTPPAQQSGTEAPTGMDVDQQPAAADPAATSTGASGAEKKPDAVDVTDSAPAEKELPPWARQHVFFANGSLFALIRLIQFAYMRLEKLKELEEKVEGDKYRFGRRNPTAEQLGLQPPPFHESPVDKYYSFALDYIEQFIEGKMDQNKFEDTIREMFNVDSYWVFTYDKLIQSIAKQVQGFTPEDHSEDLLQLYLKEQERRSRSDVEYMAKDELHYRSQAEALLGDEVSFKIVYTKDTKQLTIQVIPKPSDAHGASAVEERWSRYVDNYVKLEPTGNFTPANPVFLKRNQKRIQQLNDDPNNIEIVNRLECKICINTYRMFFVENSEDYFHRKGSALTPEKARKIRTSKKNKFQAFLEGPKGWKQDASQNAEELAQKCAAFFLGENGQTQKIEVTDESGAKFCKYVTNPSSSTTTNPSGSSSAAAAPSSRPTSQPASASTSPQKHKQKGNQN